MITEIMDQSRLDVANKTRSNIFNWRGQFTPQFVDYILECFVSRTSCVLDPFCGSGTVLLEAAARGLPAIGCEINPAAYAMSKFVALANAQEFERTQAMAVVEEAIRAVSGHFNDLPLFGPQSEYRDKYKNLLDFAADLFSSLADKRELLLALITLIRAESCTRGDLLPTIHKAVRSVRSDLLSLPVAHSPVRVELCDAREACRQLSDEVDLILTSPPYINVFNYHQNYRAILEVLGFDLLKVAESEIGSNRKNRSNRYRTVAQYCLDMEQAMISFARCLKTSGTIVLVVGHQSQVRGVPFSNSQILRDIAESLDCLNAEGERNRTFLNRFGEKIREDILVFRKRKGDPNEGHGRIIAEKHLKRGLTMAEGPQKDEIQAALSDLPTIRSSPMLTRKGII